MGNGFWSNFSLATWQALRSREARLWLIVIIGVVAGLIEFGPLLIGCGIKGNIPLGTGERLYYVRGQKYYWQAQVNYFRGERYFCSEEAAREAGWSKAIRQSDD
jgi:hypothetical protein